MGMDPRTGELRQFERREDMPEGWEEIPPEIARELLASFRPDDRPRRWRQIQAERGYARFLAQGENRRGRRIRAREARLRARALQRAG